MTVTSETTALPPDTDPEFPLVLSAGERRSLTANAVIRDPSWCKRDAAGSPRISESDTIALSLGDSDAEVVTARRGRADVVVEVHPAMCAGHISLPHGLGLTLATGQAAVGVSPNELRRTITAARTSEPCTTSTSRSSRTASGVIVTRTARRWVQPASDTGRFAAASEL